MTYQQDWEALIPSFDDILAAEQRIRPYLPPTPLRRYPAIDEMVGAEVYIKHENIQPNGSFKVRGGISVVSQLSDEERSRGLIAASTGNHGQSISRAGHMFGAPVRIVVPVGANPDKIAAMEALGAEVIQHGEKIEGALAHAEMLAERDGSCYIHAGNEPALIAGMATESLEIMREMPDVDAIVVPIGGGSGASGACLVVEELNPEVEVIGVQSTAAPAAYQSWKEKTIAFAPNTTSIEGIATGRGFELPQAILQRYLRSFYLFDDDVFDQAVGWLLKYAHMLAEPAGAAPLGAIYALREQLAGKKVAMICTGSNITLAQLRRILATHTDD